MILLQFLPSAPLFPHCHHHHHHHHHHHYIIIIATTITIITIVIITTITNTLTMGSLFVNLLESVPRGVGVAFFGEFLQQIECLLEHLQQEVLKLSWNKVLRQHLIDAVHGQEAEIGRLGAVAT